MDLIVKELPEKFNSVSNIFNKYLNVFGVHIFGTYNTPTDKILWAGNILAQYLDNDRDGEVDNPLTIKNMLNLTEEIIGKNLESAIYMSSDENDGENMRDLLNVLDNNNIDYTEQITNVISQGIELYANETGADLPNNRFDASLEEIIHLISYGDENFTKSISKAEK